MISRWRIITLSSLCIISTIACGFSAWVSNPYSDVSIDVEVGEVVTQGGLSLADLGISINTGKTPTSLQYYFINEDGSGGKDYLGELALSVYLYLDTKVLCDENIEYDNNLYLTATLTKAASDTLTAQTLEVYPTNSERYSFAFSGTNTFNVPIKTKEKTCLFDIARLDLTMPDPFTVDNASIKVPLTFTFLLSNVSTAYIGKLTTYSVTFGLKEEK